MKITQLTIIRMNSLNQKPYETKNNHLGRTNTSRNLSHVRRLRESVVHPFEQFQDITVDDAIELLQQAANKNCRLDPVPTWIIKTLAVDLAVDLAPFVALLVNTSTRSGLFPSSQKRAIVTPILKKASLDAYDLSNYRPVSNLSFISKILERAAYMQMSSYLQDNGLLPRETVRLSEVSLHRDSSS